MFFSEGWRNLPFFYIYENMAFIDLVIQDFNEGDYDLLETAFNGDANAFFNYANKKGKIEEIIADDYNHNDYEIGYMKMLEDFNLIYQTAGVYGLS